MIVLRAIDAIWNRGDLDVADEVFAADYVNHGGLIADLVDGPEAVKFSAAFFRLAYPALHISVQELSTDDNTVVVRWTAHAGPADGTSRGCAAADQLSLTGITRSRFVLGKITESWTEWDRTGVLQALGMDVQPSVPIRTDPSRRWTS